MTKELMSQANAKRISRQLISEQLAKGDQYKELCFLLVQVIDRDRIAIDDWLNILHPEECNEERVEEARKRVFQVGTAAYIAALQAANRVALESAAEMGVKL